MKNWRHCQRAVNGHHDNIVKCLANDNDGRMIDIVASKDGLEARISIDFEQWQSALDHYAPLASNWLVVSLISASPCISESISNLVTNIQYFSIDKGIQFIKSILEIVLEVVEGISDIFNHNCSALCNEIISQVSMDPVDAILNINRDNVECKNDYDDSLPNIACLAVMSHFEVVVRTKFTPIREEVEIDLDLSNLKFSTAWKGFVAPMTALHIHGIKEAHFSPPESANLSFGVESISAHILPKPPTSNPHAAALDNILTGLLRSRLSHQAQIPVSPLAERCMDQALTLLTMLLRGDICLCGGSLDPDCEDACLGGLCRFQLDTLSLLKPSQPAPTLSKGEEPRKPAAAPCPPTPAIAEAQLLVALARSACCCQCAGALFALDPPPGFAHPGGCMAVARDLDGIIATLRTLQTEEEATASQAPGDGDAAAERQGETATAPGVAATDKEAAAAVEPARGPTAAREHASGKASAVDPTAGGADPVVDPTSRLFTPASTDPAVQGDATLAAAGCRAPPAVTSLMERVRSADGSPSRLGVWALGLDATNDGGLPLRAIPRGGGLAALGFGWQFALSPAWYGVAGADQSEAAFEKRVQMSGGSFLAWHGAPAARWHGILRRGLCVMSGREDGLQLHGAAAGSGIYLARWLFPAIGYAHMEIDPTLLACLHTDVDPLLSEEETSLGTRKRRRDRGSGVCMVGLFEVAGQPEALQVCIGGGESYLVSDATRVRLRVLVVLDQQEDLLKELGRQRALQQWQTSGPGIGDLDAMNEGLGREVRRLVAGLVD